MADAREDQEAQLQIRWDSEARDTPRIYSNYVGASFTPEDFTITFGWYALPLLNEPPAEAVVRAPVHPVARVTIPLNLMPNLIALLQRQLNGYQESLGPIPDHPNKPDWMKTPESTPEEGEDV